MPHIICRFLSDYLSGVARLGRSAVVPALEYFALWHDRDRPIHMPNERRDAYLPAQHSVLTFCTT